jgi:hypothetical protein
MGLLKLNALLGGHRSRNLDAALRWKGVVRFIVLDSIQKMSIAIRDTFSHSSMIRKREKTFRNRTKLLVLISSVYYVLDLRLIIFKINYFVDKISESATPLTNRSACFFCWKKSNSSCFILILQLISFSTHLKVMNLADYSIEMSASKFQPLK